MRVSPVVSLVLQVLTIVAVLLIWRTLAPYLEVLCADLGVERFYHRCVGAVPYLIVVGIMWSVIGFVSKLVLKEVVK